MDQSNYRDSNKILPSRHNMVFAHMANCNMSYVYVNLHDNVLLENQLDVEHFYLDDFSFYVIIL